MKIMPTSFKRCHVSTTTLSAPNPAAGHHWPMPLLETPGHSQASLGHLVGSLLLSPGSLCTRFRLCPPRINSPVLFWRLYGWVNSDLLHEGLYHTQVWCSQSTCPCGSPLLTHTSTGDTQTQFCLSLFGVSGSWCAQGMFEPSECLWRDWLLILNENLPLLPSCWDFSFVLGGGVSPHSHSLQHQAFRFTQLLSYGWFRIHPYFILNFII